MTSGLKSFVARVASAMLAIQPTVAFALPAGGQVIDGQASISSRTNNTTINQTSQRTIINWGSFNIGSNESVQFQQPSSSAIALNKITAPNASSINGQLLANGNVWLLNPNGVLFGKNAQVNVGGLLATSSAISNSDFMAGNYNFTPGGNSNAIISNEGSITVAQGGLAGFVAPTVINSGVINAALGKVALASGDSFTLDMYGDKLINLQVSNNVASQLVANHGMISADGGTVELTAAAASTVVNNLINMDGVIQANSIGTQNGSVVLYAAGSNAVDGNVAANKGIKLGTSTVLVSGTIDVTGHGSGQTGGAVQVLGDDVGILTGAKIDTSGDSGGGRIQVGGDFHGQSITPTAQHTIVQLGTQLLADAMNNGNGGNVAVWADNSTAFSGTIEAKGGALSGNGGFVETSGKQFLGISGGIVRASAVHGNGGTWLLDPNSVTISTSATSNMGSSPNFSDTGSPANVNTTDIVSALNGGTSVNVTASGSLSVNNSITESTYNGTESLTLTAGKDITLSSGINITASGPTHLNVTLDADTAASGGAIVINTGAGITTNGGNIIVGGGANASTNPAVGDVGHILGIFINSATLSAGGGNIILNGTGYAGTTSAFGIGVENASTVSTTGTGTITITGTGGNGTSNNYGFYMNGTNTNIISAGNGAISITGTNGGSTTAGYGIDINETAGTALPIISTTGSNGTITLTGIPSGTPYGINVSGSTQSDFIEAGGNVALNSSQDIRLTDGNINYTGSNTPSVTLDTNYNLATPTNGAILMTSSNITTNGGSITLGGGTSPATTGAVGNSTNTTGINLSASNLNAGTGNMSLIGTGYAGTANAYGIDIQSGSDLSTTSGNITLNGTGGAGTGSNRGVYMTGAGTLVMTQTGTISMTGQGGNGSSSNNTGIELTNGSEVSSTGSGTISLTGTGGSGTNNDFGVDIEQSGSTVTSQNGNITITGTGGSSGTNNYGIQLLKGGTVTSTGTAAISMTGTGGGSTSSHGIFLSGETINSTGGANVNMTGVPGGGGSSYGIYSNSTNGSNFIGSGSMAGNLTMIADSISLDVTATQIASSGIITLKPYTNSTTIGMNGGAGTLGDANSDFLALINTGTVSPSQVNIGNSTSGTGAVTISTGWSTAVYSFPIAVYGGSISNGNVTIGGYNLLLAALNGDMNEVAGTTFTKSIGGNTTLTLDASGSILMNGTSGSPINISSSSNKLNVVLAADTTQSANGGAISFEYTDITTNGGNITLGGGSNPLTTAAVGTASNAPGILLDGSSILNSGIGNISVTGIGHSASGGSYLYGVEVVNGSELETTSGNVGITGTAGVGGSYNTGVALSTNSLVTSQTGAITVTGYSGTSTGLDNYGVQFYNGAQVTSTGTATLNITGTGASGTTYNDGVAMGANTYIVGDNGSVNVTGTGGAGSSVGNDGILLYGGGNITGTGSGNITITGIEGGNSISGISSSTGTNILGGNSMTGNLTLVADGISLSNLSMSSAGIITLKPYTNSTTIGINGGAGTLGDANSGFLALINTAIVSPSSVVIGNATAGTGLVTINDGWNISGYKFPISVYGGVVNAYGITMGGYDLTLDARTGDLTEGGGATISKSTGGNATLDLMAYGSIYGTGSSASPINISSTSNKLNVIMDSDTTQSASGGAIYTSYTNITSNGGNIIIGGGSNPAINSTLGTSLHYAGISLASGSLNAGAGNISLIGTGESDPTQTARYGIQLSSSEQFTTTSGNITMNGTGGVGLSGNNGIVLDNSTISSSAGNISLTGQATSNTTGHADVGVQIFDHAQVNATGNATISITGTGGPSNGNDYGVFVTSSGLISGQNGNVTITGQGGNNSATYNDGIVIGQQVNDIATVTMSGTGTLTLNGTGGAGTGHNNYGTILDGGSISITNGTLNITGYGGAQGSSADIGTLFADSSVVTSTSANMTITGIAGANTTTGIWSCCGNNVLGGNSMTGNLTLVADGISLSNLSMSSAGIITLKPYTNSTTIGINGGAGTLGDANSGFLSLINTSSVSPSSVVIGNSTSGTGAVTIGTGWNVSGYSFPIAVYGGSISNGNVTMGGYNLTLDALAGDINENAGSTISKSAGGNAMLTLEASGSILMNGTSGSPINISSASNKLNVVLDSDTTQSASGGAINLNYTNITTNGGNITLGGGANPSTTGAVGTASHKEGIYLNGSTLNSGNGNLSLIGTGDAGTTNGYGISVNTGSAISATGGNITLNGTGGAGTQYNYGVNIDGAGGASSITDQNGNISITGAGGSASSDHNIGVMVHQGGSIASTGSGTIGISGTGGSGTQYNFGVDIEQANALITSSSAAINITGTGGSGASGSNHGIQIYQGGAVTSTGSAPITLTGIAGTGAGSYGIYTTSGSNVVGGNSMTGNLTFVADTINLNNLSISDAGVITQKPYTNSTTIGINGGAGTLSDINSGFLALINTGTVSPNNVVIGNATSGTGAVTIGNNWNISGYTFPIFVYGGTINSQGITMGGYNLTLDALAGDVNLAAGTAISKSTGGNTTLNLMASGSILINGTSGSNVNITSSSNKLNIIMDSDTTQSASGGAINLNYTNITTNGGNITMGGGANPAVDSAFGTSSNNSGIAIGNSAFNTAAGNISLIGTGWTNSPGNNTQRGIGIGATQLTTTSGNITLNGTGGTGLSDNYGIDVDFISTISSSAGSISLTGQAEAASTGDHNIGVQVNDFSQVNATGSATITIAGTGGGGNGQGFGVSVQNHGAINGQNGNVTITGQGANTNAQYNSGVSIGAGPGDVAIVAMTGSGTLTINGTGSTGTGNHGYGVVVDSGTISATTGNVNITGQGGVNGSTADYGVPLGDSASITSTGSGNISITGIAGGGTTYGIQSGGGSSALGGNSMTGNLTLVADGISLSNLSMSTAGVVTLKPYTNSTTIGINGGAGTLSDANSGFLALINTGIVSPSNVVIGNSTSGTGAVTIGSGWTTSGYNFPISVYGGSITSGSITGGTQSLLLDAIVGNVTLNSGAVLSSTSTGTGLTLVAKQNFINNSNASVLSDSNGQWLVYSTNPVNNTLNGLTPSFDRYSCTYGGSCPSFPATGSGLLYSYTPTLNATPSALNLTYGDAAPNLSGYAYTLSGYLGSDASVDHVTGSLTGTTSYAQYDNVGSYNINYSSGALTSALGYAITTYNNSATAIVVGAKTLTASLTGLVDKIYDTTTTATLAAGNYSLSGVVNGDTVNLNDPITGAYNNKNAGIAKTVTVSGLSLSGAGAGNYTLASTSVNGTVGQIDRTQLTVTASNQSRVVGQSNPILTGSITDFKGSDNSSVLTVQPTYSTLADSTSPVGTYSIIASGAAAGNYIFTYVNGTLTITGGGSSGFGSSQQVTIHEVPTSVQSLASSVTLPLSIDNASDLSGLFGVYGNSSPLDVQEHSHTGTIADPGALPGRSSGCANEDGSACAH